MKRFRTKKLQRELARFGPKALETLAEPFRFMTFLPLYELRKRLLMNVKDGQVALTDEVAIYLIFPIKGIQKSHLFMLKSLVQEGVSPIVVSNLPLSEDDRALLGRLAYKVIERPNIGYDFGGYRDGILFAAPLFEKLKRLWILNDSAWLVAQNRNWFEAARDRDTDFVGTVSNRGVRKVDIEDHQKILWNFNHSNNKFHYVSNSWCLGSRIITDPEFLRFWKRLQIRHSKQLTVRRGEIGFSQWVLKKGFSHSATLEIDNLDQELASLSDADLDQTTRNLLMIDAAHESIKNEVLDLDMASVDGRANRISLCLAAVARFGTIIAMPYYFLKFKELPFFKKSIMAASPTSARLALSIIDDISGEAGQTIRAEAKALLMEKHV